jgi:long-chain acyl-CoA synthetase
MTTPPSKIATHTSKPGYYGAGSVPVAPPAADDEGPTRRLAISADALVERPFEGIETVWDVVEYVAKTHGTRDALGWRDVVKVCGLCDSRDEIFTRAHRSTKKKRR